MTKIAQIQDRGATVAWSPIQSFADVIALGAKVRERDSQPTKTEAEEEEVPRYPAIILGESASGSNALIVWPSFVCWFLTFQIITTNIWSLPRLILIMTFPV